MWAKKWKNITATTVYHYIFFLYDYMIMAYRVPKWQTDET